MGDSTAVSDVTDTLTGILREGLTGTVLPDHVTSSSPAEIEFDRAPMLGFFLYQILENQHLKGHGMERIGPGELQHSPTVVDLIYLAVAHAKTRETEQQILGKVIQIFSNRSLLEGSLLQGSLAGTDEELRIRFHPVPLDELLRLWNGFSNKPYKLSVSFHVSPVRIDTTRPPVAVHPVVTQDYGYEKKHRS